MKNIKNWKPTYVFVQDGKLKVNPKVLNRGSDIPIMLGSYITEYLIKKYVKGKLLDLGCGDVPNYEFYKDKITENVCMDWAETYHDNQFLDIIHDINNPFPLPDEEFDTILSSAVLEHIYNPKNVIAECYRILKKNGILILSANFSYWEHEAPYDYFRYTQYFFKRIAEETGFKVLEIVPIGDGLSSVADIVDKIMLSERFKKKILFKILHKLTRYLFNKYSYKNASVLPQQPLGYYVVLEK